MVCSPRTLRLGSQLAVFALAAALAGWTSAPARLPALVVPLKGTQRVAFARVSPDRKELAYLLESGGSTDTLGVVDVASGARRIVSDGVWQPIIPFMSDLVRPGRRSVRIDRYEDRYPPAVLSESPSGDHLLFFHKDEPGQPEPSQEPSRYVGEAHAVLPILPTIVPGTALEVASLAGGSVSRLAAGAEELGFQFSPDGQRVLFTRPIEKEAPPVWSTHRHHSLWSVPAGGGPPIQLSPELCRLSSFWLSARGWVAMAEMERQDTSSCSLRVARFDGSEARTLAEDVDCDSPTLTRDGRHLRFITGRKEPTDPGVLHDADLTSTNVAEVASGVWQFSVTGDGAWIAFTTDVQVDGPTGSARARMWVKPAKNGAPIPVASDVESSPPDGPFFSPDGDKLYFRALGSNGWDAEAFPLPAGPASTLAHNVSEIQRSLNDTAFTFLANLQVPEDLPNWPSPRPVPWGQLVVVPAATGRTKVLARSVKQGDYRFSRDGQQVYFVETHSGHAVTVGGIDERTPDLGPHAGWMSVSPRARQALLYADPIEDRIQLLAAAKGTSHLEVDPVPSVSPNGRAIFWFEPSPDPSLRVQFIADESSARKSEDPAARATDPALLPNRRDLWVQAWGGQAMKLGTQVAAAAWATDSRLAVIRDDGLWLLDPTNGLPIP
jgi:hypothetical protein